jgi:hypothetical protein
MEDATVTGAPPMQKSSEYTSFSALLRLTPQPIRHQFARLGEGKDEWQDDFARDISCRQEGKDEETSEEYGLRIGGQRHFLRLFCRRLNLGLLIVMRHLFNF